MFTPLFKAFRGAGQELFYVGGAIRNHLRDTLQGNNPLEQLVFNPSDDVDFATSARPNETIDILKKNNLPAFPIGIEFGTIQTIFNRFKVEITTYRCNESYTKGSRKPAVVFGNKIEDDLARRDLTINAIAMDEKGNLTDPFNGFKDLKDMVLRTPINPVESFSDDPLRLLRICRFTSRGLGAIPFETCRAMTETAHKIKFVSAERIFEEMTKLLLTEHPHFGLNVMVQTGLMAQLFPELQTIVDFKQNQGKWHSKLVWAHTLQVLQNAPARAETRWAALFHDVAKPQTYSEDDKEGVHFYTHEIEGARTWRKVAKRLKMSNEFTDHVNELIFNHMNLTLLSVAERVTNRSLRRLVHKMGDRMNDLFELSLADITSHREELVKEKRERVIRLKERIDKLVKEDNIPELKLPKGTGTIVAKALNIKPGPVLGEMMNQLKQMLIDGDVSVDDDFGVIAKRLQK